MQAQPQGIASLPPQSQMQGAPQEMGIPGLPTQLPAQMAAGGIVSFQVGGVADDEENPGGFDEEDMAYENLKRRMAGEPPTLQNVFAGKLFDALRYHEATPALTPLTEDQRLEAEQKRQKALSERLGTNQGFIDFKNYLSGLKSEGETNKRQALGLALLSAADAVGSARGPGLPGLGAGLGAFSRSYGASMRDDKAQRLAQAKMQFELSQAERAESLGLMDKAQQHVDAAEKYRLDAYKANVTDAKTDIGSLARALSAVRPAAPKAPTKPSDQTLGVDILAARIKKQHPEWSDEEVKAEALTQYNAQKTPGLPGSVYSTDVDARRELAKDLNKSYMFKSKKEQAEIIAEYGSQEAWVNARIAELMPQHPSSAGAGAQPDAGSLPPPALEKLKSAPPGSHVTFGNGQVWKLENGKPVRVK
jgi:hypothetical protein